MALFAAPFYRPELCATGQAPFKSLFKMLDEFENYSREQAPAGAGERSKRASAVRMFNPKFDVRETEEGYELHGDLPGIERDRISIQFTDPQTLVVSGRVERSYTSGTPTGDHLDHASRRATVEHAPEEGDQVSGRRAAESGSDEAPKSDEGTEEQLPAQKYWLSERSIGDFSRTFSFPARVDQDGVQAGLNNGLLSIKVPKAKKQEARRITID